MGLDGKFTELKGFKFQSIIDADQMDWLQGDAVLGLAPKMKFEKKVVIPSGQPISNRDYFFVE